MVLDLRNKGGVFSCFVCFVEPLLLLFFVFCFFTGNTHPQLGRRKITTFRRSKNIYSSHLTMIPIHLRIQSWE